MNKAAHTLGPPAERIGDDDDVPLNSSRCQDLEEQFFFQRPKW